MFKWEGEWEKKGKEQKGMGKEGKMENKIL